MNADLLALGSSPVAIAVAIILASFVLEDAATIAAALAAAGGLIAPPLALAALFIGIFVGDLGLYGLGAAARTQSWARAFIGETRIERGRAWLQNRLAGALIGARFMPGFRLPAYAASGFLGVPFVSFAAITGGASFVWACATFSIVFVFGAMALEHLGAWTWVLGAILMLAVVALPALIAKRSARHV